MGTAEILVDTDVLIDHLQGARRLRSATRDLGISVVSQHELFACSDDPQRLALFLAPMIKIPVDAAIAQLAGTTRRETGIAMPDALIAATALIYGIPLMTDNRRQLDRVAGLLVVAPS